MSELRQKDFEKYFDSLYDDIKVIRICDEKMPIYDFEDNYNMLYVRAKVGFLKTNTLYNYFRETLNKKLRT